MTQTAFASLKLQRALLNNLVSMGYASATPVQAKSLPPILAGKDVIVQSKTGSGKTAAFGLGLVEKLDVKLYQVQALVLCPTRELADQVAKEIRKLSRAIANIKVLTLCGGMPMGAQIDSLARAAHIIVGTPGRIHEHLSKARLKLAKLNTLVLDEADRMLDMGFKATLDSIMTFVPAQRQILLFSATYPEAIQAIANKIMVEPVKVKVAASHDNNSIEQHFFKVTSHEQRILALRLLLLHYQPESALVFCKTKRETQALAEDLVSHGFSALALHGDLEQKERNQILVGFSNKSASILVATDVAARGLDIDALDAVINYHVAQDSEIHVHRIGRTGRADSKGLACTLYSENESYQIALLADAMQQIIEDEPLPPQKILEQKAYRANMLTLLIYGGKKHKMRPGDILGALTGENGIAGKQVGKIDLFDTLSYVAVKRESAKKALTKLTHGKLKGRSFKVRLIKGV